MQCTIKKAILVEKLERVRSVTARKNTIPILAFFRLHVVDGRMEIQATDLDISYKTHLPCVIIDGPIDTCLPAQKVYDIAREMPQEEIVFKFGDGDCQISSGKVKFKIKTLSSENFPSLSYEYFDDLSSSTLALQFNPNDLKEAINQVSYACSTEASRFSLNDILIKHAEASVINLTATDGHRLSRFTTTCVNPNAYVHGGRVIEEFRLPVRGATAWMGKGIGDELIEIKATHRGIRLSSPSLGTYYTSIRDGQFPNVDQLFEGVKAGSPRIYEVDANALSQSIRRASLVADDRSQSIRLTFTTDQIIVTSESAEAGNSREELPVTSDVTGVDDLVVGLNASYLLDVTSRQTGKIKIHVKTAADAILITAENGIEAVIMPLRV